MSYLRLILRHIVSITCIGTHEYPIVSIKGSLGQGSKSNPFITLIKDGVEFVEESVTQQEEWLRRKREIPTVTIGLANLLH